MKILKEGFPFEFQRAFPLVQSVREYTCILYIMYIFIHCFHITIFINKNYQQISPGFTTIIALQCEHTGRPYRRRNEILLHLTPQPGEYRHCTDGPCNPGKGLHPCAVPDILEVPPKEKGPWMISQNSLGAQKVKLKLMASFFDKMVHQPILVQLYALLWTHDFSGRWIARGRPIK